MKTQVILKRPFMGYEISQQSKSGLFSATDLIRIGNVKRRELNLPNFQLSQFLNLKSTREFIEELQKDNPQVLIKGKGRNSQTWTHPLLFIDIALALNPKFKIEVYGWLFDELLKYRNSSGLSYKKMCGYLFENSNNKAEFHKYIIKVANYIKEKTGVDDWNKCSKEQLELRDKIHDNISLLCDVLRNNDQAVRIGVAKSLDFYNKENTIKTL